MDDFKETFPIVLYILSMIVVFGMLTLEVAGFGIFMNPALETVWYINLGLLFLSNIILAFQAREGEVISEEWLPKSESPLVTRVISHKGLRPFQPPGFEPGSPHVDKLSTLETTAPTLGKTKGLEQKETLEKPIEIPMLEPPTKEELQRLKQALELKQGSLHYKKRGQGIYHVVYDPTTKKHRWTHIASWPTLKPKLKE